MDIDPALLKPSDCYKLLTCLVVPRPIALVTTLGLNGVINAAPFSFFNVFGSEPPILILGVGDRTDGEPKDTAQNIRRTREFVVNLVSEEIAEQMNICATDFPLGQSELDAAKLTAMPSVKIKTPRIAESPVNLECREVQTISIGKTRMVMGQVVNFQIRDDLIDVEKMHIRTEAIRAVGRMHAPGWYTHTSDLFEMKRIPYRP